MNAPKFEISYVSACYS